MKKITIGIVLLLIAIVPSALHAQTYHVEGIGSFDGEIRTITHGIATGITLSECQSFIASHKTAKTGAIKIGWDLKTDEPRLVAEKASDLRCTPDSAKHATTSMVRHSLPVKSNEEALRRKPLSLSGIELFSSATSGVRLGAPSTTSVPSRPPCALRRSADGSATRPGARFRPASTR